VGPEHPNGNWLGAGFGGGDRCVRTLFKWLFRCALVVAIAATVAVLFRDTLVRRLVEWQVSRATGMEARIDYLHVGLAKPILRIGDLKLYHPPEFGGTTFAHIPEVYAQYDRGALWSGKLRFSQVRINLAEVSVVETRDGKTSAEFLVRRQQEAAEGIGNPLSLFLSFAGIDTLHLTLGRVRYANLRDATRAKSTVLDVQDLELKNVPSASDLTGLIAGVMIRNGVDFLGPAVRAAAREPRPESRAPAR